MTGFLQRVNRLAIQASQRSDVIIAAFMMLAISMIIIPLPTPMVDTLIGLNIAFSLLILIVAFYITHPVDFSALPPIILLATLFRLALSITTTRLILLQADAGQIVSAFGHFVIADHLVIGLVVFFIIAVAQFLVITKGSERVAEVAARFVLDAMPGKQMSIDNDIRNGDLDAEQGRIKRDRLERESQLYGAMDGAMKFVKGDAIAVLIILFVNLVGGLLVGMFQHDMSFGTAIRTYSLLTVGDGLIAQIPALLISVGAGTVVTRVSSDNQGDLGSEIVSQLGNSDRALGLTAFILFAVAFIPGFTAPVFLTLSAGMAFAAWMIWRRRSKQAGDVAEADGATNQAAEHTLTEDPGSRDYRVLLLVSRSLAEQLSAPVLGNGIETVRDRIGRSLGIEVPDIGHAIDPMLDDQAFHIELDAVPVLHARVPAQRVRVPDARALLEDLDIRYETQAGLPGSGSACWVDEKQVSALEAADVAYEPAETVLCDCLAHVVRRYAAEFVGIQETRDLLSSMEDNYSALVQEATSAMTPPQTAEIFRRLVEEGVAVKPLRTLLEGLAEWAPLEQDTARLTEHVRVALARRICHQRASADGLLSAWVVTPELEQMLQDTVDQSRNADLSTMPEPLAQSLKAQLGRHVGDLPRGSDVLVMISDGLRRPLYEWSRSQELTVAVMAWSELAPEFRLQSVGQLVTQEESEAETQSSQPQVAANR